MRRSNTDAATPNATATAMKSKTLPTHSPLVAKTYIGRVERCTTSVLEALSTSDRVCESSAPSVSEPAASTQR